MNVHGKGSGNLVITKKKRLFFEKKIKKMCLFAI